jgi:hypothetical protein
MTIIEFLKLEEQATILNLSRAKRWLYWDTFTSEWVIKDPEPILEHEAQAVKMLSKKGK